MEWNAQKINWNNWNWNAPLTPFLSKRLIINKLKRNEDKEFEV